MKTGAVKLSLLIILVTAASGCVTTVIKPSDVLVKNEDAAIARLGDDINSIRVIFHNKKIGIYYFTSLDWQIVDAGKRLSGKLADYLSKKGLTVMPRTELNKLLKIQADEHASLYNIETFRKKGKTLAVDAVIIGTVVEDAGTIGINIKVADAATGRLILLSGVRMPATGEAFSKASPEKIALYKESPDKITALNTTYYLLHWMKTNQPLVFMLAVIDDKEMKSLKKSNAVLYGKLSVRKERYQRERPDVMKKIKILKEGLSLLERYDAKWFGEITVWKKDLLARMK